MKDAVLEFIRWSPVLVAVCFVLFNLLSALLLAVGVL